MYITHDIFGSQISKTIEDIYQEIIDEKERNLQPNAIAQFFKSVKSKIDYLTTMVIDKLQLQKRNLPWFVVSIIVMMACIFLIFHTNPWKGAILIVSLTLALSIYLWIHLSICSEKERESLPMRRRVANERKFVGEKGVCR